MSQRTLFHLLLLVVVTGASSGCNAFFSRRDVPGFTKTSFDNRLPDGIRDVFTTCHKSGFNVLATTTSIDFRGTCPNAMAVPSVPGQLVYASAASTPPVALVFPLELSHTCSSFGGFPFPLQNCSVSWDTQVFFWGIGFKTLESSWVLRSSGPALKVALGNPRFPSDNPYYKVAYHNTLATANCPSPINQGIVRAKLDKARVNSLNDVAARDVDLDIFFVFGAENGAITVKVESELRIANISVGIDWDKLPKTAKRQFDAQLSTLTSSISSSITGQLQPLSSLLSGPMQSAIPKGHQLCSVKLENGQLVITTRDRSNSSSVCRPT